MDSLNLGETWLLDKKSRNLVEWDTFRLWLVIACNHQNRCDMVWQKHGAEIFNCNRQSYGATKTIYAHNFKFNWLVLKPNLSHFSCLKSLHKKHIFRTFRGLSGGGRSRFYKGLCTRVLLQNAVHDKSHPETRTLRIGSVLCGWKKLWAWILWTWVKLDYWTKRAGI